MSELAKRIDESMARIGKMCSEGRPPRMSIPAQPYDDDLFITETLKQCKAALSGVRVPVETLKALYASYALEDADRKKCAGGTWPRDRTESMFDALLDDIGVGAKYREESELREWLAAAKGER